MVKKIKSFTIIDLNEIIEAIFKDVLLFSVEYEIKNVNDLTNLFISRSIIKISEYYKEISNSFICFHLSNEKYEMMVKNKSYVNFKKFFNLLKKKIGFPLIISDLSYEDFISDLQKDDMSCEEMLMNYKSFSEIFPKLYEVIRKYRYKKADNKVIKEVKNLIKMFSSI